MFISYLELMRTILKFLYAFFQFLPVEVNGVVRI